MYQLYAYPDTYSIGVHLLLEESGVNYEIIDSQKLETLPAPIPPTEHPATDTRTAFLQASPHGRVPAIVLPDGSSMCESGAIALHLSDTLCAGRFSVLPGHTERPHFLQWLFYLSSTLQPEVMLQFHPEFYFSEANQQQELSAASLERLDEIWSILDTEYASGPWLFDNRPTAVDFCLATVLVWPICYRDKLTEYPNLNTMMRELAKRSAFQSVMAWHQPGQYTHV